MNSVKEPYFEIKRMNKRRKKENLISDTSLSFDITYILVLQPDSLFLILILIFFADILNKRRKCKFNVVRSV